MWRFMQDSSGPAGPVGIAGLTVGQGRCARRTGAAAQGRSGVASAETRMAAMPTLEAFDLDPIIDLLALTAGEC
jgi:hypothetical protein